MRNYMHPVMQQINQEEVQLTAPTLKSYDS